MASPSTHPPAAARRVRRPDPIGEHDLVDVACGCHGEIIAGGVHLKGEYPHLYVKVIKGCRGGHPVHAAACARGVIQTFAPEYVTKTPAGVR